MLRGRRRNGTSTTCIDVISPKVQRNVGGGVLTRQTSHVEGKFTSDVAEDGKLAVFEGRGKTLGSTVAHEQPTRPSDQNGPQRPSPDSSGQDFQLNMGNPAISTYTNRFGHVHVIDVSCKPEIRIPVSSPSVLSLNTVPKTSTRPVCRLYLIKKCQFAGICHRYHPPEQERVLLLAAEKNRIVRHEICRNFQRGFCQWDELCNRIHQDLNQAQSDATLPNTGLDVVGDSSPDLDALSTRSNQDYTTPRVNLPNANPQPLTMKVEASTGDSSHDRNSPRQHVKQGETTSSSTHGKKDINKVKSPSENEQAKVEACKSTPVVQSNPNRNTTQSSEVCKLFLEGRCNRSCQQLHPLPVDGQRAKGSEKGKQPSEPEGSADALLPCGSGLAGVPNEAGGRSTLPQATYDRSKEVCRLFLRGRCWKRKCPFRHVRESKPMPVLDAGIVTADKVAPFRKWLEGVSETTRPEDPNAAKLMTSESSFSADSQSSNESSIFSDLSIHMGASQSSNADTNSNIDVHQKPSSNPHATIVSQSPTTRKAHSPAVGLPAARLSSSPQATKQARSQPSRPLSHVVSHHSRSGDETSQNSIKVTLHEHMKIALGNGFEIQEVVTGFESRWVILGNVPSNINSKTLRRALQPFGQVDDLKIPSAATSSSMTVRALFSTPSQAIQAAGALNGAHLFSKTLAAHLPINNSARGNAILHDSSVSIEWDAPGRLGFAGYNDLAEAEAAVLTAHGTQMKGSIIAASVYEGIPALGAANVRFVGLPPDTKGDDLHQFGKPEAVMLERPNYSSVPVVTKAIRSLLEECGELLSFEVFPPPYHHGLVKSWAHFSSPTTAHTAANYLNGRRPLFLGKRLLKARHVPAISYPLPSSAYDKLASDIAWLRRTFWVRQNGAALSIVDRRARCSEQDNTLPVLIKLFGEDVGELGHLKSEFEHLLHGEKLMEDGKIVWNGFFERPQGAAFLYNLERTYPGVEIQKAIGRRTITMFGPSQKRRRVRTAILEKIARVCAQQVWVIPVPGRHIALFMSAELMELQESLGKENVDLNLREHTLTIRGNEKAFESAQRAVHQVEQQYVDSRRRNIDECPVCFNEVVSPIRLSCGHTWCKSCLSNYLLASVDNKMFPLTCLGNEATCSQPLSITVARDILPANDFDAVANASFTAYLYAHTEDFYYCPTADCSQIYRATAQDTILQCPSCLVRICPKCHVEAHDGISCAQRDVGGEELFHKWMEAHDVKVCPGCKTSIERIAGCNHITCTRCQTHICWVCMKTFVKGEGIYDHMRMAHGGIGL